MSCCHCVKCSATCTLIPETACSVDRITWNPRRNWCNDSFSSLVSSTNIYIYIKLSYARSTEDTKSIVIPTVLLLSLRQDKRIPMVPPPFNLRVCSRKYFAKGTSTPVGDKFSQQYIQATIIPTFSVKKIKRRPQNNQFNDFALISLPTVLIYFGFAFAIFTFVYFYY